MPAHALPDRIAIDGTALEVAWIGPGPGEAPTLVLLHEGLGSISMWGRFPADLAAATGCGVLVYSRAGYGKSDPVALPRTARYMHDEALAVLPKLLDAVGFRRGVLVGHSDGASIAAIYAGGVADNRVRGLVLMAPHFFVEEEKLATISEVREAFETGDLRVRLARHHGDNVEAAFRGWNEAWLSPDFRDWDLRSYLPNIRVPVLLIQGRDDRYGSLDQLACVPELAMCPVETVLLEKCGHSPHKDQPEATLAAITGFLRHLLETHGEAAAFQEFTRGP
jgi:pimeloyl-ACP methyl ester carboxylesterase